MWSFLVNVVFNLIFKCYGLFIRLVDFFRLLPIRLGRLINHFSEGVVNLIRLQSHQLNRLLFWWLEFIFYLLDLVGITEVVETLNDFLKFNTRPLHDWEIELAQGVFGKSLNYNRIRIDQTSWLGPRQFHICYVFGFTINSWGKMHNSLLIHELVHVWQYQKLGLVYIPRALQAYFSEENYNYGGVTRLEKVQAQSGSIWDFNLEQQGDILADYYRIKQRDQPQWGSAAITDIHHYEYFVKQLKGG
jgi:hypothetical protein